MAIKGIVTRGINMKPKLYMVSRNFRHDRYSTCHQECPYFEWSYEERGDYTFYIDADVIQGVRDRHNGKKKFLWTLESPYFNGRVFDYIQKNLRVVLEVYEKIFTYSSKLLALDPKFCFVPAMGTWVRSIGIRPKTRLLSMITSCKSITPLHRFRRQFAKDHQDRIDVFGKGFRPVAYKEEGLDDYMFTVCIENAEEDGYFTEKVLDAFATGTVPVYKGTRSIANHFDADGILFLEDTPLSQLTPKLYESKRKAIENNARKVREYACPETYMWEHYLCTYFT